MSHDTVAPLARLIENVIVEEVERAVLEACRRGHAEVIEFTVAPRYPSAAQPRGGHEWLIEFAAPRILELPAGTFYRWMRERGKLSDQHRVPRVTNDRVVADGLLGVVAAQGREPLVAVTS